MRQTGQAQLDRARSRSKKVINRKNKLILRARLAKPGARTIGRAARSSLIKALEVAAWLAGATPMLVQGNDRPLAGP